jgi:hypothetical protein
MHRRSLEVRDLTLMTMRGSTTQEMVGDEQIIQNSSELLQKGLEKFHWCGPPLDDILLLDDP